MQARNRSICEMACEVQASGLCVPDWLGEHCKDADLYDRMRDQPTYAGWENLCREIEHSRRWLFDELPDIARMGIWNDKTAALMDYARRVNQPELPAQVARLWNHETWMPGPWQQLWN